MFISLARDTEVMVESNAYSPPLYINTHLNGALMYFDMLYNACKKLFQKGFLRSSVHALRIAFEFSIFINVYCVFTETAIPAPQEHKSIGKTLYLVNFYVVHPSSPYLSSKNCNHNTEVPLLCIYSRQRCLSFFAHLLKSVKNPSPKERSNNVQSPPDNCDSLNHSSLTTTAESVSTYHHLHKCKDNYRQNKYLLLCLRS